jgi:hypothetical protein
VKAAAAFVFLVVAVLVTHTGAYNDEVGMAADRAEQEERLPPALRPQTDPIKPPRCPRVNAVGMPLMESFAAQADGGEWIHECWYGVQA